MISIILSAQSYRKLNVHRVCTRRIILEKSRPKYKYSGGVGLFIHDSQRIAQSGTLNLWDITLLTAHSSSQQALVQQ